MRKNQGITLIALVITIIVLLILAGISIATLTGENGILTKTKNAKEQYQIEQAREKIQLAITDYQVHRKEDILYNYLEKIEGLESISSENTENIEEPPFWIVVDGYEFYIDENLNIEYIEPSKGIAPEIIKVEQKVKSESEVTIEIEAKTEEEKGLTKIILLYNGIAVEEKEISGKNIKETFSITSNGEYKIKVVAVNKKQAFSETVEVTKIVNVNGTITAGTIVERSVVLNVHGESSKEKIKKVELYSNNTKQQEKVYQDGTTELNEKFTIQNIGFYEEINCYAILIDEFENRKKTNQVTRKNETEIADKKDLEKLAKQVNESKNEFEGKTVKLIDNIDLQGTQNNQWTPIGNSTTYFKGTFDGNYHKINHLYIKSSQYQNLGLFAILQNQTIVKNVILENVTIENTVNNPNQRSNTGGIAGQSMGKNYELRY